jgi:ankyrin repeat protein
MNPAPVATIQNPLIDLLSHRNGETVILQMIKGRADPMDDEHLSDPGLLAAAMERSSDELVAALMDRRELPSGPDKSIFMAAVVHQRTRWIEHLVAIEIGLLDPDSFGHTPLHHLIDAYMFDGSYGTESENVDLWMSTIDQLIRLGVDMEAVDASQNGLGRTAMLASAYSPFLLSRLIDHGANAEATDSNGQTALDIAICGRAPGSVALLVRCEPFYSLSLDTDYQTRLLDMSAISIDEPEENARHAEVLAVLGEHFLSIGTLPSAPSSSRPRL